MGLAGPEPTLGSRLVQGSLVAGPSDGPHGLAGPVSADAATAH